MTTIEEYMMETLHSNGMPVPDCEAVLARVKVLPSFADMEGRWEENYLNFSGTAVATMWNVVKREAASYMTETKSEAWYRSIFLGGN